MTQFGSGCLRICRVRRLIRGEQAIEQASEFFFGKAQEIEIEGVLNQRGDFVPEHRIVPARIFRDPVVGDHQRPALGFRKMRKHDDRHLGEPELLGGDQHRVRAKLAKLVALAEAGDVEGLKAIDINPVSTSPKAMARYRDLAIIAIEAR